MGIMIYILVINKPMMKIRSSNSGIYNNGKNPHNGNETLHTGILRIPNNEICLVFPFMGF